jgi:hypothetical protein
MIRSVVFSRASRTACSRAENCQATAAAEETSMIESRPKPTKAVEEEAVPAVIATIVDGQQAELELMAGMLDKRGATAGP